VAGIQEETDSLQTTEARTRKEWLDTVEEDPLFARLIVFFFAHSHSGIVLDGSGWLHHLGRVFDCRRVGALVRENSSARIFGSDHHHHVF
jgi:hypothetical protein